MVRIAHISDSHLGSSLFQLVERKEDARRCFQKAIDMAMKHSPDIVVHTGDVFDSPEPSTQDISCAIEGFRSIGDRARVFVLQGNHDLHYGFRRGISPIRTLEIAGVARGTGDSIYTRYRERIAGENVEIHLISWSRTSEGRRIVDSIKSTNETALLFTHDLPYDRESMPATFDYIGFGHAHNFLLDEELNTGRPGSTCIVDWRKEWNGRKKIIIVDIDETGNTYETETLNDVREFRFVTKVDITGLGSEEAENYLKEQLDKITPKKKGRPIVIMQVEGIIDSETENSIKRTDLLEYGNNVLNPLFLHIEPGWQSLGPRPVKLSEPLNVSKSVLDYAQQTGHQDVEDLLRLLDEIRGAGS